MLASVANARETRVRIANLRCEPDVPKVSRTAKAEEKSASPNALDDEAFLPASAGADFFSGNSKRKQLLQRPPSQPDEQEAKIGGEDSVAWRT